MDRDDHLALTSLTLNPTPRAVPFEVAFATLPGQHRTEVLRADAVMREIHRTRIKSRAIADLAARSGRSAETLKRLYYGKAGREGWINIGIAALIDHRKCGGCGCAGCTWAREKRLRDDVVEIWRALAGANDKQSLTEGWEQLIRKLGAGEVITAGVTWQTVFMDIFPGLALPDRCPWSTSHPPPGWSLANFTRQLGSKAVFAAQKKGNAAAWEHTPDVRMDLSELRFLEAVVFDDHRLDFKVRVWDDRGRVQTVELWGLFAMDVATGAVIDFGLRPRIQREDGTSMGLTMRDMQHLIAHILATYGYPTNYTSTLIVENAAAAVSAETEQLLRTRTQGQVVVRRTGVHFSDGLLRGWGERWGAPRGKAWLESWFHILDIVLGSVQGQTGSDYKVKPGDLDGREKLTRKINAIVSANPELAGQLHAPFEWAGDAHRLIAEAINLCNARTDHEMARHRLIHEWRYNEHDTQPKPCALMPGLPADIAKQVSWYQQQDSSLQDLLLNHYGTTRRESPTEKVQRLYSAAKFQRIAPDTFIDLFLDVAAAEYKGGDVLDIEVKQGKERKLLRYHGHDHRMEIGQRVRVRFDSTRPGAGVWIVDDRDRHLGHMKFARDPRMLHAQDVELLQRALGAKNKAHAEILDAAAKRSLRLPARGQEIARIDEDLQTLATLNLPAPAQAPALPESADLARAVIATKPRSSRKPTFKAPAVPPPSAAEPAGAEENFSWE